jgi:glycosyltransferase involved in cell wall biosynthesis
MAWGNEMMWPLAGETGAIMMGQIDTVLYVSPAQRAALEPEYRRILAGSLCTKPVFAHPKRIAGEIDGGTVGQNLKWVMVGNYIDPSAFPFRDRKVSLTKGLVVGRLSRADPSKFPPDFPASYESLGLRNPRFRVMGWGRALQECWSEHHFDSRWELLEPQDDTAGFLQSLDLFVYEVGHQCRESWGRVVVEAMLTGAVPLVPAGGRHHLESLVQHQKTGFICQSRADYARFAQYLEQHPVKRHRIARAARAFAVRYLCNVSTHLRRWDKVFHGP